MRRRVRLPHHAGSLFSVGTTVRGSRRECCSDGVAGSDPRKNLNTYKTKTYVHAISQRNHYLGTLQTSGHESRNCHYFNELRQIKE
jgi:hypothetical protein